MKYWIKLMVVLLAVLTFDLGAQSGGYYQPLNYRDNDPFLFCRYGQNLKINPLPCWRPMPPYTGNFMMMPYCRPPNPWGKNWTRDDLQSLAQYVSVCPNAIQSGLWEGREGLPELVPHDH